MRHIIHSIINDVLYTRLNKETYYSHNSLFITSLIPAINSVSEHQYLLRCVYAALHPYKWDHTCRFNFAWYERPIYSIICIMILTLQTSIQN